MNGVLTYLDHQLPSGHQHIHADQLTIQHQHPDLPADQLPHVSGLLLGRLSCLPAYRHSFAISVTSVIQRSVIGFLNHT